MGSHFDEQFDSTEDDFSNLEWEVPEVEPEFSQDVTDLLRRGHLEDLFDFGGNQIRLRTLKIGEELEIGPLIKKFQGTDTEDRSIMTATVAAALEEIDSMPVVASLGPEPYEKTLKRKFAWAGANLYWPTIRYLFERYMRLVERQIAALEEFAKKEEAGRE